MNSKILYFVGGVVAGSVATFFVVKRRIRLRADEEIESVRESYKSIKMQQNTSGRVSEKTSEGIDVSENNKANAHSIAAENARRKADFFTSNGIIKDHGYGVYDAAASDLNTKATAYNLFSNPPKAKDIHNGLEEDEDLDILDTTPFPDAPGPYVLEDDELSKASDKFVNEEPYFDKITLFYYNDGVLCSENNEIITNISETIGPDSLRRIGEYEPDVVYVRNSAQSTDYEIIRQYRDFADIPPDDD